MNNEEKVLRTHIRKAIRIVNERKKQKEIFEETKLRNIIRKMISEAKKVPKWESYGKNNLDVMFMKTNFLDALETGYKALTTTREQRESYKNHIIQNVKKTLNLEKAKEIPGDQSNNIDLSEQEDLNVTLGGGELMGLKPEEEKKKEEDGALDDFKVEGDDYSGLREAYEAFNLVQDTLLKFWKKMDLDEDKDVFYDNMLEQLNLYFDKWEGELDLEPEGPDMTDTPMDEPAEELTDEPLLDLEPEEEEEEGL
tara:strand:- start:2465 stop:3223 length:759 start_codon:yes stop_codon:yes gene_type:complete